MKNAAILIILFIAAGFYFVTLDQSNNSASYEYDGPPITPNWAAIASWPEDEGTTVEATPDPNRRITAIVLDDSGSMGSRMDPAKNAVVQALGAMSDADRVAVIALNRGLILPFMSVGEAQSQLVSALAPVFSDGSTPLTQAVTNARTLLEQEAAAARAFGTYRVIVTTDGEADDGVALASAIEAIAAETPIQITTIGIDIAGGHVLRRDDLGSFVDVADMTALEAALKEAVAENADFAAITEFEGDG